MMPAVLIASALGDSLGLIGIFVILIGGLVNVLLVYIAIQVIGERASNQRDREGGSPDSW